MVWRATPAEARHADGTSRKRAMKERVDAGAPVGLLGYLGGVPVAWCSIAPRCTYRAGLAGAQPDDAGESVWSVVCFFVERQHRGQGVFRELLDHARRHAIARGATILEAYPVDEESPSYRFGGFFPAFEKAGFVEIGRAGARRHVVRLRLV
jgi:GNAT superfamily N-acetyltransferase